MSRYQDLYLTIFHCPAMASVCYHDLYLYMFVFDDFLLSCVGLNVISGVNDFLISDKKSLDVRSCPRSYKKIIAFRSIHIYDGKISGDGQG